MPADKTSALVRPFRVGNLSKLKGFNASDFSELV